MDHYGTAGDDILDQRILGPLAGIDIFVNIWGSAGSDTITLTQATGIGEAGNDTIVALDDVASPAAPNAVGYMNSPAGVTVNLTTGTAQDGFGSTDTLVNLHMVIDSAHSDHITGSPGNDLLVLRSGSDTVVGGGGDDTVHLLARSNEVATTYDIATGVFTQARQAANGATDINTYTGISTVGFSTYGTVPDNTIKVTGTADGGKHVVADGAGRETLVSGAGNDVFEAGDGIDTMVYSGNRAAYTVTRTEAGFSVEGAQGRDTLSGVERLTFADRSIAFDISGVAGQAYRMYQAVFGRDPDIAGMGFWLRMLDQGVSLTAVAQGFVDSAEFDALYGADATNTEIVTRLYANVFNGVDGTGGIAFRAGELDAGHMTLADLVMGMAESAGNVVDLVGVTQNGVDYIPYD